MVCAACLQHTRAPLHPSDARVLFISRLPCAHLLFKFKRKEFLFFLFGTCITRHERRKPAQQNCSRGRRCSKPGAPSVVDSIRRVLWRHDFVVGVAGVLCGLCCSRATGCNSTRGRRHHRLLELHYDGVGVRLRTRYVLPTRCWCCYRQAHCCAQHPVAFRRVAVLGFGSNSACFTECWRVLLKNVLTVCVFHGHCALSLLLIWMHCTAPRRARAHARTRA